MKRDVTEFIRHCHICQQHKYTTHKPFGNLQPLPMPSQVWEDISMDFITHLPLSQDKSVIWVVVDRLTKYAHFLSLPPKFSAHFLASSFLTEIFRLHGMPRTIVSDHDRVFISAFWRELFRLSGTTLTFSSVHHPQMDGQTEVLNRVLETYLRCFVSDTPRLWVRYIHLAEYCYNSSYHTAIRMSPFQALYGRSPPNIHSYVAGTSKIATLDESLQQRHTLLSQIKHNLSRARFRMEQQANLHRQDCTFEVGDWVYLKLQPYRQISLHTRPSQKLAKRFFGPFQIMRRISAVAYELELPTSVRIHPVFHVSLLKPCRGQPPFFPTPLPTSIIDGHLELTLVQILGSRSLHTANGLEQQILVQWNQQPESAATWESLSQFRSTYPNFYLKDKVSLHASGIDTPGSSMGWVNRDAQHRHDNKPINSAQN